MKGSAGIPSQPASATYNVPSIAMLFSLPEPGLSEYELYLHKKKFISISLACLARPSSRVRRESWEESKNKEFTNEPSREISRGVFQNRGVCG